jgi:hypothetical protein
MAFTQAQLQTEMDAAALGLNARITKFDATASASYTDVGVQNFNETKRKVGTFQIAQSNTAAQALTAIQTALNA